MTRINIPLFSLVAIMSTLLPIVVGGLKFRSLDRRMMPVLLLLTLNAASTLTQVALALSNTNNLWTLHIYLLFELPLSAYAFSRWVDDVHPRTIFRAIGIIFLLFWLLSKLWIEDFDGPATYSAPVSRILLVVSSIYCLYHISSESESPLLGDGRFWFLATSIVFASGSAMFAALQSLIGKQSPEVIIRVYNIYWTFLIFINLGYSWAFLCKPIPLTSGGR